MSVPSPCVDVCRIDPRSGWCEGCLRTLDEIAGWSTLEPRQQLAVCRLLPRRRETRDAEQQGASLRDGSTRDGQPCDGEPLDAAPSKPE